MDVDAAGHEEQVGGVDYGVVCGSDMGRDLGDGFAFDEDVGVLRGVGVDDGGVLDECAHGCLASAVCWLIPSVNDALA